MHDKVFETALWGFTWEEALNEVGASQGTASLTRDGLILDIPFGLLLGEGFSSFDTDNNPKPVESKWVYGFSRKGDYQALSNAIIKNMSSSTPGGDSQRIRGDIFLSSKAPFNPDGRVRRMAVSLTGLKEWVGSTPFYVKYNASPFVFRALKYDYRNEDAYNKELYSCNDLTISIYHTFTATPLTVDGMNITHDCRLEFDFTSVRTMDKAIECIKSLSQFLSFCLGFHSEIQMINLLFADSENPVELYSNFTRGAEPTKNEIREVPIHFNSIEGKAHRVIGAWLNAENELDIACRMIASLVAGGWEMPIDLRFLAASQALEALSRVGAVLDSLPEDAYQNRRDVILGSITDTEAKTWIQDRMPGNTKGQSKLLKELLERHSGFSDWLIPNRKAFTSAHTATRNAYTHRTGEIGTDSNHLVGEDLHWHTEAVIVLCQGIIWDNLGVDWKLFIKRLTASHYKSYAIERAREMYRVEGNA